MELWAAIDLMGGSVVTLVQGRPEDRIVWKGTPLEFARRWQGEGADGIHVVDLDAAFGTGSNEKIVSAIVDAVEIPVELGGGIRSALSARKWLDQGVARVVLGTVAYRQPEELKEILSANGPEKLVVAADYRDGEVVVKGWKEGQGLSVFAAAKTFEKAGVSNLLATSVGRDGMAEGPDLETIRRLSTDTRMEIIASGGIRNVEDLVSLEKVEANAAVIGRALYDGGVKLEEFEKSGF